MSLLDKAYVQLTDLMDAVSVAPGAELQPLFVALRAARDEVTALLQV